MWGVVQQRLHQFKLSRVDRDKYLATEAQEGQKSSDLSHHDLGPLLQFPVYTRRLFVLVSSVVHGDNYLRTNRTERLKLRSGFYFSSKQPASKERHTGSCSGSKPPTYLPLPAVKFCNIGIISRVFSSASS